MPTTDDHRTIQMIQAQIELAQSSYSVAVDHLNAVNAAESAAYEAYCNRRQAYDNINSDPDAIPIPNDLVQWAVDRAADDLFKLSKELESLLAR